MTRTPDSNRSSDETQAIAAVPTGLLVGGSRCQARSGHTLIVEDPATGKALCEVSDAGPEDGMDALAAST